MLRFYIKEDWPFDHLGTGELLHSAPAGWRFDWELADPDMFRA